MEVVLTASFSIRDPLLFGRFSVNTACGTGRPICNSRTRRTDTISRSRETTNGLTIKDNGEQKPEYAVCAEEDKRDVPKVQSFEIYPIAYINKEIDRGNNHTKDKFHRITPQKPSQS